ncbi:MAG: hypothetical protein RL701_3459 [Pseudomonadota bacterium]
MALPTHAEDQQRALSSLHMSVKLMGMAAMIVALLGAIVFLLVHRIFDTLTPSIRHDLEWKARHGVIELCGIADLAVVGDDREAVAQAAAELVRDPDVLAIHVTNVNGTVFDYGHVPFAWSEYKDPPRELIRRGEMLIASRAVEIETLEVGRVWLAVSTHRLRAGMELRRDILVVGGLGALVSLLLALAFVRLYIVPILRLTTDAFHRLERTTLAALESARIKSEFLANMSHEIRTPMNGIMGVTKLAIDLPMSDKLRRYIEVIDTSARGLLTIINDVLDFSKIEAGKYEIHPRAFDPRSLVDQTTELFLERAKEKGIALVHRVSADVPIELVGDADRIKQILVNLLGNALKFTETGEVFVHVTSSGQTDASLLRVSVRDTGCGISAAAQTQLFQAFTQVDGSSVRQHGGTGLGLVIAKRLAELMDGAIGVESEPGRGSEFWFTVAVRMGRADASRVHSTPSQVHAEPLRELRTDRPVLVVDDNEINRFVAVEHLNALGFYAETVQNGAEAVAAVFAKEYAAVLMDCQMPTMDGYTAAREIRRREPEGKRIPIIAVTAHALVGERENVLAAGMDDFLPKPVNALELERALLHWTGHVMRPDTPATPMDLAVAPTSSAPDQNLPLLTAHLADLDPQAELRPRLVELFLRQAPQQLDELLAQVRGRDAEQARALAHKLKGGLYAVSASPLADELEALRRELVASSWNDADARAERLEARFLTLREGLQQAAAARTARITLENKGAA